MMVLFVNGIFRGVQCDHVGFLVDDLDSACDLLNELVNQDWHLQQAVLLNGEHRQNLPVAAFDGQPMRGQIGALQSQWQQILAHQVEWNLLPKQILNKMVYAVYEFRGEDWVMACRSQQEAAQRLNQIHLLDPGGLPLGYMDTSDQRIHLLDREPPLTGPDKATYEAQLIARVRQAVEAYIHSLSWTVRTRKLSLTS